ncbi:hypothetical protein DL93DRAFT_1974044 [Clavulina sp. PMI_390]|nr:hypothetical protein DL93DRAFT_1974044 [Clavulina sp. PMI_390]
MSMTSSRPPSYTTEAELDHDSSSVRTVSPLGVTQQRAIYVYYRIYRNDAPLPSRQAAAAGRGDGIGWLRVEDLPPPCTVRSLKRCIARAEGLEDDAIESVFLSHSDETGEEDGSRLNLLVGAPGTAVDIPVNVVLLDEASPSGPTLHHVPLSPISLLSGAPMEAFPSTSKDWWTVDAISGFGNPKTDAADENLIDASPETIAVTPPPGWARTTLSPEGARRFSLTNVVGFVSDTKGLPLSLGIRKWDVLYVDLERAARREADRRGKQ